MSNPGRKVRVDAAQERRIAAAVADGVPNYELVARFKLSDERIRAIAAKHGVKREKGRNTR